MLYKVSTLIGYKLHGLDGIIGEVDNFYFDDHHWTVRYMVAETNSTENWKKNSQVLISPYSLISVMEKEKTLALSLNIKQIQDSPSIDTDKPVSRQFEKSYNEYYGLPWYWNGALRWGNYPHPERDQTKWNALNEGGKPLDGHLRSTNGVQGNDIEGTDEGIGQVDDFIVDDENWAIRYIVVDTKTWWSGKKVLISPSWVKSVSWCEKKVYLGLSKKEIRQSPEFTAGTLPTRNYETELHRHYNRKAYWI